MSWDNDSYCRRGWFLCVTYHINGLGNHGTVSGEVRRCTFTILWNFKSAVLISSVGRGLFRALYYYYICIYIYTYLCIYRYNIYMYVYYIYISYIYMYTMYIYIYILRIDIIHKLGIPVDQPISWNDRGYKFRAWTSTIRFSLNSRTCWFNWGISESYHIMSYSVNPKIVSVLQFWMGNTWICIQISN